MFMFLIGAGIFWFVILFCDTIFKTCMFHPYFKFLQISGLEVRPLYFRIRMTRFNRFLNQLGRYHPLLIRRWFDIGAFVSCILVIPCIVLYFVSWYQIFRSSSIEDYDNSLLVPVIPGYNIPVSHIIYYIVIIMICYIVHEFGHALAASRERISIESCGVAVYMIFPMAFVDFRIDQFKNISLWQQLRIICGGIWHNIILSLMALLIWWCIMPAFSTVFYTGMGVSVLGIRQQSALNQAAGFRIGDQIISIGDCAVQNHKSWNQCLREKSENSQTGFCVPQKLFENVGARDIKTCVNSSEYVLFQVSGLEESICLPVRPVVQNVPTCSQNFECESSSMCIFPVLTSKSHRLVVIERNKKKPVLYEGSINEVFQDVEVSDFVPKFKFLPASYAETCITFLLYIIMFSSGLAILNMMPVFASDGEYMAKNLVHLCLEKYVPKYNDRTNIFICINRFGIVVLVGILVVSVYKLYIFTV